MRGRREVEKMVGDERALIEVLVEVLIKVLVELVGEV